VVPVAFIGRTSTLMQHPVASLRRQVRKSQAWLPAGFKIVAWYWDVGSGGLDLEQRSQGSSWQAAAGAGIPRDGGMADLLKAARSPEPPFAFVICEDIERSARDNYNSLKLERRLRDEGIAIFATDEPFNVAGVNATTILVRRVKQGVAEWYRLQLKEKVWEGLKEHNYDGWNIGPVPYGYTAERHTHPNPMKAAAGRTKTRLAVDPARGPIITTIYRWRVTGQLGVPTIRARLNADPGAYPPPDPDRGWTLPGLYKILANPKYTGSQVLGRTHITGPTRRAAVRRISGSGPARPPTPPWWIRPPEMPPSRSVRPAGTSRTPNNPKPGPAAATGTGADCGAKSANGGCAASPAPPPTPAARPATPTTSAPTTPPPAPTRPPTPITPTS
jgi:hypothetical protein